MSLAALKFEEFERNPRTASGGDMAQGPLRCVLMDDSRFDRRYLRNIAANSRFEIEFVETSTIAETKAVLNAREADFLVLDNLLPDGSGLDLAEQLSQDAKLNGTPVILTTGASSEEVAIQALRVGAADYLTKENLSTETFDQAVENALKRSASRSADQAAIISNLQSENSALRRIALRNMRLLKSQVMPLMSFAWRMLRGDKVEDPDKQRITKGLRKVTSNVTGLIDDTVISSATYSTSDNPEPIDLSDLVQNVVQNDLGEIRNSRAHIKVGALPTLTARRAQVAMLFEELLLASVRMGQPGQVPEIEIGSGTDPKGNPIVWLADRGIQLSARKQTLGVQTSDLGGSSTENGRDEYSWSLCQRLAEKNDGEFRVTQDEDNGAKVMIRFPKSLLLEENRVVSIPAD